ncbi:hypothetical protein AOQ84DRAFT_46114 [Glonium stellatum]|uniref:Uncharacterized protein n=1 Tax=Glonium stellatum TaxID=574774 RepID=A0A8E2JYL1_9PEZI|nr:hypothetical protein AOQ84DRAFT_46114 [Glonium stellatum]
MGFSSRTRAKPSFVRRASNGRNRRTCREIYLPAYLPVYLSTCLPIFPSSYLLPPHLHLVKTVTSSSPSNNLPASIILHFQHSDYPLSHLQIVRAKTQSRELGPKGKEELRDCWYAALVAPDAGQQLGFKVLVTGPAFVGNQQLAKQEAFLGLRDRLEEMTHEKLRRAGSQTEKAREVEVESSAGLGKGNWSGSGGGGGTVVKARELV